jgi:tetratricopeptide (TPR) repeat protein
VPSGPFFPERAFLLYDHAQGHGIDTELSMKKWHILAGILLVVLAAAFYAAISISRPSELPEATGDEGVCAWFDLTLDRSSIDRIYADPASILEDPALFWAEDSAYSLVATAPQYRDQSVPPQGWARDIERLAAMSDQERMGDKPYARASEIEVHADTFCEYAMPIITSLLPEGADPSTTVYLTAFNDPPFFAYRKDVVMNIDMPLLLGDTAKFFNILAHETFHIGFFDFQPFQTEVWSDYYPAAALLMTLQNDGLALYTQYLVSVEYPARLELELLFLESDLAVSMLIRQVNDLFQDTEAFPEDEIMSRIYEAGTRRALYVVGAYMARTIDEQLGRESLVETVAQGPRSFVTKYNRVAKAGREIHEFPEPAELSPIQLLRQAALQGDLEGVAAEIETIEAAEIDEPGGAVFEHLMSTGLLLLEEDQTELALEVFQLMVSLFPEHPYSYLYLGDAYSQLGVWTEADEAYQQALEIDPRLEAVIDR